MFAWGRASGGHVQKPQWVQSLFQDDDSVPKSITVIVARPRKYTKNH